MPTLEVFLPAGHTETCKAALMADLAHAVVESISAPIEAARILLGESPETDFGIAGRTAKSLGR
ncbi:4-oxalocrotonate tautomerase [Burkholderia sp. D7]|nr:4-oxalocrotonate tautomerase [Burkholderia sp. D7]